MSSIAPIVSEAVSVARQLLSKDMLAKAGLQTSGALSAAAAPIGFGAGLLCGAAVGMLFAPKSGKELRAELKAALGRGMKRARDVLPHGQEPTDQGAQADNETSAVFS